MPSFHRKEWCKFLWGNPCTAVEPFSHSDLPLGLLVLDAFLSVCCVEDLGEGFGCRFCTLIQIVLETAFVSFWTLPVSFPLPTESPRLFVHAVLPCDSWPRRLFQNFHFWPQHSSFSNSVRYFSLPLFSMCDSQVRLSSDRSPHCTIPIRSWVSQTLVFLIWTILPRCHQMDQVSDLSSSEEAVFFVSFYFLQTVLFREAGILDDFVQCWSNSRVEQLKVWTVSPLTEREYFRSSTCSTISTSLIDSIASVGNC